MFEYQCISVFDALRDDWTLVNRIDSIYTVLFIFIKKKSTSVWKRLLLVLKRFCILPALRFSSVWIIPRSILFLLLFFLTKPRSSEISFPWDFLLYLFIYFWRGSNSARAVTPSLTSSVWRTKEKGRSIRPQVIKSIGIDGMCILSVQSHVCMIKDGRWRMFEAK